MRAENSRRFGKHVFPSDRKWRDGAATKGSTASSRSGARRRNGEFSMVRLLRRRYPDENCMSELLGLSAITWSPLPSHSTSLSLRLGAEKKNEDVARGLGQRSPNEAHFRGSYCSNKPRCMPCAQETLVFFRGADCGKELRFANGFEANKSRKVRATATGP